MKTVFVSGDFNILHPGHLRLLKFAKESGDKLIVGVYSNQISSKKSLLDEKFRIESIKAVSFVDEVLLIDKDLKEVIEELKPNIIVKGKEHENKNNIESNILKQYGGKLIFASGEVSFSHIEAIKKDYFNTILSNINHDKEFLDRHKIKKDKLKNIIENFSKLKVLVIGEAIVDEYIENEPLGMSQEDPTIVVRPILSKKFIGGAAIVASHAKTLGADVSYISVLGDDENFHYVNNELNKLQIDTKLLKDFTRPTILKQRYRANNKTLLRVNNFKSHAISKELQKNIISKIKELKDLDLIIFADFSYGILPKELIKNITYFANKNNIKIVADSQSSSQIGDITKFFNTILVTPTEREIRLALNDFESGLVVLCEKLKQTINSDFVFTTLGKDGLLIYEGNQDGIITDKLPAFSNIVNDVSGAGDSLLTSSSMALCSGANIWESAYIGSLVAAIQVSRIGNIPIKKEEVLKELNI